MVHSYPVSRVCDSQLGMQIICDGSIDAFRLVDLTFVISSDAGSTYPCTRLPQIVVVLGSNEQEPGIVSMEMIMDRL